MKPRAEKDKYKLNWQKAPSVTTGGKKYFYYIDTDDGRIWVSWSKQMKLYVVSQIQGIILYTHEKLNHAKKYVERNYQNGTF